MRKRPSANFITSAAIAAASFGAGDGLAGGSAADDAAMARRGIGASKAGGVENRPAQTSRLSVLNPTGPWLVRGEKAGAGVLGGGCLPVRSRQLATAIAMPSSERIVS